MYQTKRMMYVFNTHILLLILNALYNLIINAVDRYSEY